MVKLENNLKKKKIKIGILGGTFDPAHKGHLEISKQAKKILELKNIIWAITKQNPFKNTNKTDLKNRIKFAKKFIGKNNFIKVKFYEEKVLSNKTIDLINYLDKDKKFEIYFIMGADNLINFHKWYKWKSIIKKCNLLVFDRQGYKAKSLKSVTFNGVNKNKLSFINFKKVNISSSQLRKI